MVLSDLIIVLYRTIRPKIRVFIDFFLSCAHDHSTEICGFLIFFFFFCTTIQPRLRVLTCLIFLYAHNHLIKICGPLPFIITFEHDHSTKVIRVLIYIFISFVHDHSTKIRGHSYSLIYLLINCVNVSYATFMAVLISYTVFMVALLLYFVRYIHGYMKYLPTQLHLKNDVPNIRV